jgi:hypothetical protein
LTYNVLIKLTVKYPHKKANNIVVIYAVFFLFFTFYKDVKCDKTSAEAILGEALTFNCDIQDFGEVTYISVNDLEYVISDTDRSVSVLSGVDATVSEANVVLSFSNVSCSQKGDYLINLNNATDVTLSLRVICKQYILI